MSEQVFYSWHHANAYETASEVVLDVTVYPNPGTMQVGCALSLAWLGFAFEARSDHACTRGHAADLPSLAA
jgi:hypothetical protein